MWAEGVRGEAVQGEVEWRVQQHIGTGIQALGCTEPLLPAAAEAVRANWVQVRSPPRHAGALHCRTFRTASRPLTNSARLRHSVSSV